MENLRKTHGKEFASTKIYKPESYSNTFENPDPAPSDFLPDHLNAHRRTLTAFGEVMYGLLKSKNESGEELWLDFISTFRRYSLQTWPEYFTYKWCQILKSRGVHVDNERVASRAYALEGIFPKKNKFQPSW